MPIEQKLDSAAASRMSIASVRILRLALGTSLSLWFSQAVGWQMSFVAPVFTSLLLATPMPGLKLKAGLGIVVVLGLSMNAGMLLLPMLLNQPAVGILLLALALYWSFYFTAKGGSAALGTFATIGIAVTAAIGSVSVTAVVEVASSMVLAAFAGIVFVWLGHWLVPDSLAAEPNQTPADAPPAAKHPDLADARWRAFRSFLIVMPIALFLIFSSASTAYVAVMLKVASMGQQATNSAAREAGSSLMMSTLIGGAGAIIGWEVLSISPTLLIYTLLIALAGLIMGPRIFKGTALNTQGATWSYGYLTMIVLLAPAVMDSIGGDSASMKFWDRIIMFLAATAYAVVAVNVVDAFRRDPLVSVDRS